MADKKEITENVKKQETLEEDDEFEEFEDGKAVFIML